MNQQQEQDLRKFIQEKALCLLDEKEKETGVGQDGLIAMSLKGSNFFEREGRTFYVIYTPLFYRILHRTLPDAIHKYPDSFGNNDADLVLDALYNIWGTGLREDFEKLLEHDQFAYLVEFDGGKINEKLFRIELFSQVSKDRSEFTGGIFHAFNHFTWLGIPLSSKNKGGRSLEFPYQIFETIIQSLFLNEFIKDETEVDKFYSFVAVDDKHEMKIVYHFQQVCLVYFLTSVFYRKARKKKKLDA